MTCSSAGMNARPAEPVYGTGMSPDDPGCPLLGEPLMKKPLVVTGCALFVFLVMACGGLSNEEACKKVESLCSGVAARAV